MTVKKLPGKTNGIFDTATFLDEPKNLLNLLTFPFIEQKSCLSTTRIVTLFFFPMESFTIRMAEVKDIKIESHFKHHGGVTL